MSKPQGYDVTDLRTFEEGTDYADDLNALLARGRPAADPDSPSATPSSPPSSPPRRTPSLAAGAGTSRTPSRTGSGRTTKSAKGRKPVPAVRKGRISAAAAGEGDHISRIIYLPVELIERMRLHRAQTGQTNTQIALRAINAHWREVEQLASDEQAIRIIPGDLFDDFSAADHSPKRQVEITPTKAQLAAIEPLVDTAGVRDRSHLFTLVIRTWLDRQTH